VQYHFNARWYDAGNARFISEDPARDGVSWFAYVKNNPMRYIDPTGLRRVDGDEVDSDEDNELRSHEIEERKQNIQVRREIETQLEIFELLSENQINEEILEIYSTLFSEGYFPIGSTPVFGEDRTAWIGAYARIRNLELKDQITLVVAGYYNDPVNGDWEWTGNPAEVLNPSVTIYTELNGEIIKQTYEGQTIERSNAFQFNPETGSTDGTFYQSPSEFVFSVDLPPDHNFVAATFSASMERLNGTQFSIQLGVYNYEEN
jgi:hypothetical protein